jgi:hypothetical protein
LGYLDLVYESLASYVEDWYRDLFRARRFLQGKTKVDELKACHHFQKLLHNFTKSKDHENGLVMIYHGFCNNEKITNGLFEYALLGDMEDKFSGLGWIIRFSKSKKVKRNARLIMEQVRVKLDIEHEFSARLNDFFKSHPEID